MLRSLFYNSFMTGVGMACVYFSLRDLARDNDAYLLSQVAKKMRKENWDKATDGNRKSSE